MLPGIASGRLAIIAVGRVCGFGMSDCVNDLDREIERPILAGPGPIRALSATVALENLPCKPCHGRAYVANGYKVS